LDGETIPNPLRSFVSPANGVDFVNDDDADYSKLAGYETVRYPKSGLVGPADKPATDAHNAQFPDEEQNIKLLNDNVVAWLNERIIVDGTPVGGGVAKAYRDCLDAPNYTVFSNTTSVQQWDGDLPAGSTPIRSLESPHNAIHLAVGGFDITGVFDASPIDGANGDMGENDTAGFDPISTSIIASSTRSSGRGRNGTRPPTNSTSSPSIRAPIPWIPRTQRRASRPIRG